MRHRLSSGHGLMLALLVPALTGCYEYVPLQAARAQPPVVSVDVSDRGRLALAEDLGPGVVRVEGTLLARTDSAVTLAVREVTYLTGQANRWTGERLVIATTSMRDIRARQVSRKRTFAAVGAAVGGALVFVVTRGLDAFGGGNVTGRPDPPQQQ